MPLERRGGDRVRAKNNDKRIAIRWFVEGLKCVESHYCRSKTFQRLYLPAELSIRKLWQIYNSTVNRDLQGRSKGIFNPSTVRSYVWTELDHQRGSNEIASAVHHTLTTFRFGETVKTVRLFCDGCGAQNKNSIVIGMLCNWLQNLSSPNIEEVQVIFPIVGHSYIPPDRLFGQIEKVTKKKSEITSPGQYIEITQKWGKVYKLGDDIPVFDWKSNVHVLVKPPSQWHFKLQLSKRIIISRRNGSIAVRGESFYRNNLGNSSAIVKRGRKMRMVPYIVEKILRLNQIKKLVSISCL
nr:unnamed protein product [Callosobruchus analis]